MNQVDQPQADEVDLRNLFLKMWATRTPAFIALLVVTLGYWGIWAAVQWSAPTTYSRLIQFTFRRQPTVCIRTVRLSGSPT